MHSAVLMTHVNTVHVIRYLTNLLASLVGDVDATLQLGALTDRSACSIVNGLEAVAAMGVVSQHGLCARRGMSDAVSATNRSPPSGRDFYFQAVILNCSGPVPTLACCHAPPRFELRLRHSTISGLGHSTKHWY